MLQVEGWNPVGACPGWKRGCGRKRHEHYFCSRCRIFRVHLSWIRNLCLFLFILNFCSVLNFWTYMFFLCTLCFCRFALPALPGLAPASLLAAIFRGRARRARPLFAIVVFYYYYYYYYYYYSSSLPMGVYGSPMNGTWENDEIWHTLRYGS